MARLVWDVPDVRSRMKKHALALVLLCAVSAGCNDVGDQEPAGKAPSQKVTSKRAVPKSSSTASRPADVADVGVPFTVRHKDGSAAAVTLGKVRWAEKAPDGSVAESGMFALVPMTVRGLTRKRFGFTENEFRYQDTEDPDPYLFNNKLAVRADFLGEDDNYRVYYARRGQTRRVLLLLDNTPGNLLVILSDSDEVTKLAKWIIPGK